MDAIELKRRIARLKREKKEEEERRELRRMERGAIGEAREAKRERRIAGIGLAVEKAKVYKALPLPHLRPRDEEEAIRREERRAEKTEAEAARQIALSKRRTEAARTRAEAAKTEAEQITEEKAARRARLLTEQELRRERLRPYTDVGTKVVKGVGKVGIGLGKAAYAGLEKLGKMGLEEPKRKRPKKGKSIIDLGLKPRRKEQPIDLGIKIE